MVWQRSTKSPRIACAGSSPAASANLLDLLSYGVAELERRESLKLVYVGSNPTSVASLNSLTRSALES